MFVTYLFKDPDDIEQFRIVYPVLSPGTRVPIGTSSQTPDALDGLPDAAPPSIVDGVDDEPPLNLVDDFDLDAMSARFGFGKNRSAKGKFKKPVKESYEDSGDDSEETRDDGTDKSNSDEEDDEDDEDVNDNGRPVIPDPTCPSSPSLKIVDRRGGSDDYGRVRLAGGAWVSNYEYNRLVKIAENRQLIASLNIPAHVQAVVGQPPQPPRPKERTRAVQFTPSAPSRVLPARASKSQTTT